MSVNILKLKRSKVFENEKIKISFSTGEVSDALSVYIKDENGKNHHILWKISPDRCHQNFDKANEIYNNDKCYYRKALPHEIPQPEPKGYCIKRTSENAEVLNEWANKQFVSGYDYSINEWFILSKPLCMEYKNLTSDTIPEGFKELFTVEEFFAKVGYTSESAHAEPVNTEYVHSCSQTDELYRHMFDEHDLNFSTQDLKKIIEIANRSRLKPVQVDTPIERIPFDLEKWNSGKYNVVNGVGVSIEILKIDNRFEQPVIGIDTSENDPTIEKWSINGAYVCNGNRSSNHDSNDLFIIPKKETVWVNVYHSKYGYATKKLAIDSADTATFLKEYIETIEVKQPIKD